MTELPPNLDATPVPRTQGRGCLVGMGTGLLCAVLLGLPALFLFKAGLDGMGILMCLGIPFAHWIWVIVQRSQVLSLEDHPYRSGLIIGALLFTGLVLLTPPLLCFGYFATHPLVIH